MPSLYEISAELHSVIAKLEELDIDDITFDDTLESVRGDFDEKCIAYAMIAKTFKANADAIASAVHRMQKRELSLRMKAERLEETLKLALENAPEALFKNGKRAIHSPYFDISIRRNPPSVFIAADADLPECFMMTPPRIMPGTPDKKALREALNNGLNVPGVSLVTSTRVEIK